MLSDPAVTVIPRAPKFWGRRRFVAAGRSERRTSWNCYSNQFVTNWAFDLRRLHATKTTYQAKTTEEYGLRLERGLGYEMNNKMIRKARRFNSIQSKGNYWITCDIHCHSTNSTRVWLDVLMSHTPRVSRLHAVFGAYAPCRHGRTVVGKSAQLAGYGGTKVKLRWSAVWMLSWWSHRERWAEFQISWCYYRPRAFMLTALKRRFSAAYFNQVEMRLFQLLTLKTHFRRVLAAYRT